MDLYAEVHRERLEELGLSGPTSYFGSMPPEEARRKFKESLERLGQNMPDLTEKTTSDNDKYVFTGETMFYQGRVLYRIKAIKDFNDVKAGDLGGWIQRESCLAHYGNAWVYDDAMVFGDARVYGDAMVRDKAQVSGNALVRGKAKVLENAAVWEKAEVFDKAVLRGHARVYGNARVSASPKICDCADVSRTNKNKARKKKKNDTVAV
jgi:NDP-sugar pyrophosphorylase family protein